MCDPVWTCDQLAPSASKAPNALLWWALQAGNELQTERFVLPSEGCLAWCFSVAKTPQQKLGGGMCTQAALSAWMLCFVAWTVASVQVLQFCGVAGLHLWGGAVRRCAGCSGRWGGGLASGAEGRFFSLLFEAFGCKMQILTFKSFTNKTSSCHFLFALFLLWSFSLNFSTSISRQWLLISSCRSHLWRRLGSLWSVSAGICAWSMKMITLGIALKNCYLSCYIFVYYSNEVHNLSIWCKYKLIYIYILSFKLFLCGLKYFKYLLGLKLHQFNNSYTFLQQNLYSFQILFHQTCSTTNRRTTEQEASSSTENKKHTRIFISFRLGKCL